MSSLDVTTGSLSSSELHTVWTSGVFHTYKVPDPHFHISAAPSLSSGSSNQAEVFRFAVVMFVVLSGLLTSTLEKSRLKTVVKTRWILFHDQHCEQLKVDLVVISCDQSTFQSKTAAAAAWVISQSQPQSGREQGH